MNLKTNVEGTVSWQKIVSKYAHPDLHKSLWQLANTLIPYFVLFYLTIRSVDTWLWLTIPLAILTAGFLVRDFIIFHDCGHGSYFESQTANDWIGVVTGILAFTPYHRWKHEHAIHHATCGTARGAILLALRLMPKDDVEPSQARQEIWDILVRILIGTSLILLLTGIARSSVRT
jgi:fatty acid desaturase